MLKIAKEKNPVTLYLIMIYIDFLSKMNNVLSLLHQKGDIIAKRVVLTIFYMKPFDFIFKRNVNPLGSFHSQ